MSGSGGGSFGGFHSSEKSCEELVINTQLSSPKQLIIQKLEVGDTLAVKAQQIEATVVVVALHEGEVAGGLASPVVNRLRECLENGTEYQAKITEKNDGQVRVRVYAK